MILGIIFEIIALYYQYQLDYYPCVLCIHVRLGVLGFILIAILAMIFKHLKAMVAISHLLVSLDFLWLLHRSYLLLGTERGFIESACTMEPGFPQWFAIDIWFPAVFQVWEPCGYTPELFWGITMAEMLLIFTMVMSLSAIVLAVFYIKYQFFENSIHDRDSKGTG